MRKIHKVIIFLFLLNWFFIGLSLTAKGEGCDSNATLDKVRCFVAMELIWPAYLLNKFLFPLEIKD